MKDYLSRETFEAQLRFDEGLRTFPENPPEDLFQKPTRGDFFSRFRMYGHGYGLRTREAMEEMFETLPALLGEKEWLRLGAGYTKRYPSKSYNLSDVGLFLPEYLKAEGVEDKWVQLAELEVLIVKSFHAPQRNVEFSEADFSRIQEGTQFYFQPSVLLFSSTWQCGAAWKSRTKVAALEAGEEFLVTYRWDYGVYLNLLCRAEFEVLSALSEGLALGEALGKVTGEMTAENLSQWMLSWFQNNYFYKLEGLQ